MSVWVAHGEGGLHVPSGIDPLDSALAPMRYLGPDGQPTEVYPFNPNGSPAHRPDLSRWPPPRPHAHPERLGNALWQWTWLPDEWRGIAASPWLQMFQNAFEWCSAFTD